MQTILNNYINENKCELGYFTIVQYDDGPLLKLPENTIIYGSCSGTIPMPLIYQDIDNKLKNLSKVPRDITCSFVGINTNQVRALSGKPGFKLQDNGGWTPAVNKTNQTSFTDTTLRSKFALAPRGYGRGSFRFYEVMQLGAIPIYMG